MPAAVVHARQATELPANAIVRVVECPDPYDPANRISVLASLRDDPLGRLHSRGQVTEWQFAAGRQWQWNYERTQLWGSSELKDPVDGSGRVADPYVSIADASRVIIACAARLGDDGNALIHNVLGNRMFLFQVAQALGLNPNEGSRDMAYLGRRLRECLDTLAKQFHLA